MMVWGRDLLLICYNCVVYAAPQILLLAALGWAAQGLVVLLPSLSLQLTLNMTYKRRQQ